MKAEFVNDKELFDMAVELFEEIGLTLTIEHIWNERDLHEGFKYVLMDDKKFPVARAIAYTNRKKVPARKEYLALNGLIRVMKAKSRPFIFWDMVETAGGASIPFENACADYIEYRKSQGYSIKRISESKRKEYEQKYNDLYFRPSKKIPKKFSLLGKSSLEIIRALRS